MARQTAHIWGRSPVFPTSPCCRLKGAFTVYTPTTARPRFSLDFGRQGGAPVALAEAICSVHKYLIHPTACGACSTSLRRISAWGRASSTRAFCKGRMLSVVFSGVVVRSRYATVPSPFPSPKPFSSAHLPRHFAKEKNQ